MGRSGDQLPVLEPGESQSRSPILQGWCQIISHLFSVATTWTCLDRMQKRNVARRWVCQVWTVGDSKWDPRTAEYVLSSDGATHDSANLSWIREGKAKFQAGRPRFRRLSKVLENRGTCPHAIARRREANLTRLQAGRGRLRTDQLAELLRHLQYGRSERHQKHRRKNQKEHREN